MEPNRFFYKDGSVSEFADADNILDREDGPAIILNDSSKILVQGDIVLQGPATAWFANNVLHRDDGPALTSQHGERYFIQGVEIRQDDFNAITSATGRDLDEYLNGTRAERYLAEKRLRELDYQKAS